MLAHQQQKLRQKVGFLRVLLILYSRHMPTLGPLVWFDGKLSKMNLMANCQKWIWWKIVRNKFDRKLSKKNFDGKLSEINLIYQDTVSPAMVSFFLVASPLLLKKSKIHKQTNQDKSDKRQYQRNVQKTRRPKKTWFYPRQKMSTTKQKPAGKLGAFLSSFCWAGDPLPLSLGQPPP